MATLRYSNGVRRAQSNTSQDLPSCYKQTTVSAKQRVLLGEPSGMATAEGVSQARRSLWGSVTQRVVLLTFSVLETDKQRLPEGSSRSRDMERATGGGILDQCWNESYNCPGVSGKEG